MNTHRRIFRGRGGPTDGRLPKKKPPSRRPQKPAFNKYTQEEETGNDALEGQVVVDENEDEDDFEHEDDDDDDDDDDGDDVYEEKDSDAEEIRNHEEERVIEEEIHVIVGSEESKDVTPTILENSYNPCIKEVRHLKRRVQNIEETMSLSHSICDPKTYQVNVLNAVANCVNEWRSIATHYSAVPFTPSRDYPDDVPITEKVDHHYLTDELKKPAALAVYGMIQHAIQCGPLSGSKPGYFKRCGGTVAGIVLTFLDEVIPNSSILIDCMGFTSKQMDAMEGWKKNATKAMLDDKPPSRTALKHQQGTGTGKKAKKKR